MYIVHTITCLGYQTYMMGLHAFQVSKVWKSQQQKTTSDLIMWNEAWSNSVYSMIIHSPFRPNFPNEAAELADERDVTRHYNPNMIALSHRVKNMRLIRDKWRNYLDKSTKTLTKCGGP